MLIYTTDRVTCGLVALYDIWSWNRADKFLQPHSCTAILQYNVSDCDCMYKFCFIMHSVHSYFFSFNTHCIHNKTVTRRELTTRLTRYQLRTSISLTLLSWAYIRTCKTVIKTYFVYIFSDIFKQWSCVEVPARCSPSLFVWPVCWSTVCMVANNCISPHLGLCWCCVPRCYSSAQLRHQWTTNMEQSASWT